MTDELPQPFDRLTPRPAPAHLRGRVLAAVERELATVERERAAAPRGVRWQRFIELGVAACLAVGIGLNVWHSQTEDAWRERVYGSPSVPPAIAAWSTAVQAVSDADTARAAAGRLVDAHHARRADGAALPRRYGELVQEFSETRSRPTL